MEGGAVERRTACQDCAARAQAMGWISESPRLERWDGGSGREEPAASTDGNGATATMPKPPPAEAPAAVCAICGERGRELHPHLAVSRGGVSRRGVCDRCRERAQRRGWMPEAPQLAAAGAELGVAGPVAPARPEPAIPRPAAPARRLGRVLAPVVRMLSAVLITTGVLGIADVVITLTWQEPITAVAASIEQGRLSDEVATLEQEAWTGLGQVRERKPVAEVAAAMREDLKEGDAIGRLSIDEIGIDFALVEDAGSDASLRKGPARYSHTYLPGEEGTMGIAGHRTTYDAPFNDIDALEPGDEIVVDMPYGDFTYAVKETEIVRPDEVDVLDSGNREKIVLTACHPLYSAAQRIVVTGVLQDAKSDRPGIAI